MGALKLVVDSEKKFRVTNLQERPELAEKVFEIMTSTWPLFILNDPVGSNYWLELYVRFPQYQIIVQSAEDDEILGIGNSIPVHFTKSLLELPDEGWTWAIRQGLADHEAGQTPNYQCALAATVPLAHQGKELSPFILKAMKSVGMKNNLKALIAPVRPSEKHKYPLIDFADYCTWKNDNGEFVDLWLRMHQRLGAKVIRPCMASLNITGNQADWENWTSLKFKSTGSYSVPKALVPVDFNLEKNLGIYKEPNLWMVHPF